MAQFLSVYSNNLNLKMFQQSSRGKTSARQIHKSMSWYYNKNINLGDTGELNFTEAYSEISRTSKMKHFDKIAKG